MCVSLHFFILKTVVNPTKVKMSIISLHIGHKTVRLWDDDLGKYFSALSNEANLRDKAFAWLAFGVHDKTREILGTSFKNSMKSLQKLKQD